MNIRGEKLKRARICLRELASFNISDPEYIDMNRLQSLASEYAVLSSDPEIKDQFRRMEQQISIPQTVMRILERAKETNNTSSITTVNGNSNARFDQAQQDFEVQQLRDEYNRLSEAQKANLTLNEFYRYYKADAEVILQNTDKFEEAVKKDPSIIYESTYRNGEKIQIIDLPKKEADYHKKNSEEILKKVEHLSKNAQDNVDTALIRLIQHGKSPEEARNILLSRVPKVSLSYIRLKKITPEYLHHLDEHAKKSSSKREKSIPEALQDFLRNDSKLNQDHQNLKNACNEDLRDAKNATTVSEKIEDAAKQTGASQKKQAQLKEHILSLTEAQKNYQKARNTLELNFETSKQTIEEARKNIEEDRKNIEEARKNIEEARKNTDLNMNYARVSKEFENAKDDESRQKAKENLIQIEAQLKDENTASPNTNNQDSAKTGKDTQSYIIASNGTKLTKKRSENNTARRLQGETVKPKLVKREDRMLANEKTIGYNKMYQEAQRAFMEETSKPESERNKSEIIRRSAELKESIILVQNHEKEKNPNLDRDKETEELLKSVDVLAIASLKVDRDTYNLWMQYQQTEARKTINERKKEIDDDAQTKTDSFFKEMERISEEIQQEAQRKINELLAENAKEITQQAIDKNNSDLMVAMEEASLIIAEEVTQDLGDDVNNNIAGSLNDNIQEDITNHMKNMDLANDSFGDDSSSYNPLDLSVNPFAGMDAGLKDKPIDDESTLASKGEEEAIEQEEMDGNEETDPSAIATNETEEEFTITIPDIPVNDPNAKEQAPESQFGTGVALTQTEPEKANTPQSGEQEMPPAPALANTEEESAKKEGLQGTLAEAGERTEETKKEGVSSVLANAEQEPRDEQTEEVQSTNSALANAGQRTPSAPPMAGYQSQMGSRVA